MLPFVAELPARHGDGFSAGEPAFDLVAIELIAAAPGFFGDLVKITSDCGQGIRRLPKTNQLRVMAIASGFSGQHFLAEQTLAPQGDQALTIQIFGVDGPKAHILFYGRTDKNSTLGAEKARERAMKRFEQMSVPALTPGVRAAT